MKSKISEKDLRTVRESAAYAAWLAFDGYDDPTGDVFVAASVADGMESEHARGCALGWILAWNAAAPKSKRLALKPNPPTNRGGGRK